MAYNPRIKRDFTTLYSNALNDWPKEIEFGAVHRYSPAAHPHIEDLYKIFLGIENIYLGHPEEILIRHIHEAIYWILCDLGLKCSSITLSQIRQEAIRSQFEALLDPSRIENYPDEDKKLVSDYFSQTRSLLEKHLAEVFQLAEQGSIEHQFEIGDKYYWGSDLDQNYVEAVKWYTLAANGGHKKAQFKLGTMFERGDGVNCDYERAHYWYALSGHWDEELAKKHLTESEIRNIKQKVARN